MTRQSLPDFPVRYVLTHNGRDVAVTTSYETAVLIAVTFDLSFPASKLLHFTNITTHWCPLVIA